VSTNIALTFQTNYDLALLSAGLKLRLVRLFVNVRFKTAGGWTAPYEAIVDTGNPITIIPQKIHITPISDYPQQQAGFEIS